jgi:hypothetical protein
MPPLETSFQALIRIIMNKYLKTYFKLIKLLSNVTLNYFFKNCINSSSIYENLKLLHDFNHVNLSSGYMFIGSF